MLMLSCMFLDTSMLVAANPLPHIIPDERKCHGVLNCNNANLGLGNLVNVGDIPIKAIIPMSVRLQFYVHYYFGNRCSPRIPLPLVSFTFLAETSCALRLVVRPESQQHFIHTCFSLYSAGCHSNGQPYQWAASQVNYLNLTLHELGFLSHLRLARASWFQLFQQLA